jgi:hypothetical protein
MPGEMSAPTASLRFLQDWQQQQQGVITRGGRLTLDYDKTRLTSCFARWHGAELGDIVAYCRFHPRGDIVTGSVLAPVHDQGNPSGTVIDYAPVPLELPVPIDSTNAEIWLHNFFQTSSRCDAWDSRFGQNYWFAIDGPSPRVPAPPVRYRTGAMTRPDIVNVLEQHAAKVNAFVVGSGGAVGTNLQTTLTVVAWVQESPYGANECIDLHMFDGGDQLIQATTVTLPYAGFGSAFRYEFSGMVYQGSTATPGSVDPRPDARTLQYRLYYDVNYQAFTDGTLHQIELPDDAVVR